MAQWHHHTPFRFYLQKYAQNGVAFPVIDIEEHFKCRYVSLENTNPTAVKNTYTEDYAEHSGKRLYVPAPEELAYDTSELTLTLRWRSDECGNVQQCSDAFFNYITGQKIEYHDTFRPDKYRQLIMTAAPSVKAEQLHGDLQFRFMQYKLTNWAGKIFTESQIPTK